MTAPGAVAGAPVAAPAMPPVTQLTIGSLALVISGGIVMAASFPGRPSLLIPTLLLAASALLWIVSVLLITRLPGFAWPVFLRVARWALLAYAVIAGMIAFSFVHNGVSGAPLLVVSLMLVMFALDVSLSISFTVARFQGPGGR